MSGINFLDKTRLVEIFKAARFQKEPTMQAHKLGRTAYDIGGCPYTPVEAVIADRDNNPLGACWIGDIDALFVISEEEGDNEIINPNLTEAKMIYELMIEMRRGLNQPYTPKSETAKSLAPAVEKQPPPTAQIIPLHAHTL